MRVFPGELYPAFSPDVDTYEVELPLAAVAFSLSVAPVSPYAQVAIDGVVMRLTTVPRDTTTRIEITGPSGEVSFVTLRGRPSKQTAYLKATNPDMGDGFGVAVALSADGAVLAVGAPGEDSASLGVAGNQTNDKGIDSGAVYVYRRDDEVWRFDGYVKSRLPSHAFGAAVALSRDGGVLAVGEPDEDSGASSSGAVEVYARHDEGWRHQALIKAPQRKRGAGFGASVALAGETLAIGAPGEDAAYVARACGFEQLERVAAERAGERFGEVVTLGADGEVVAVSGSAATRVYQRTRAGLREVLEVKGQAAALSGDGMVIAALEPDRNRVQVYRSTERGWFAASYLPASGEHVALDFTGKALVVGNVVDRFNYRGGARLFRWDGSAWLPGERLDAANGAPNDLVGTAVTIDAFGATVALGAPGEDGAGPELSGDPASDLLESAGAVYLFR